MSNRYFIPISLGNHFYSRNRIAQLGDLFSLTEGNHIFVLCDCNRFFAYRASGVDKMISRNKVVREINDYERMLEKISRDKKTDLNITTMSQIAQDPTFIRIGRDLNKVISHNAYLSGAFHAFTNRYLSRFYEKDLEIANAEKWQSRYVFWETVLSIYMTEVRDFSNELYKTGEGMFINFVYAECQEEIRRLLKKDSLRRKFFTLEDVVE